MALTAASPACCRQLSLEADDEEGLGEGRGRQTPSEVCALGALR